MAEFDVGEVRQAIEGLVEKLGIQLDGDLQKEYQAGHHPTLLTYEKLEQPSIILSGIQKYLIGAQAFLNQPCTYYDIFRSCRHVVFIQLLDRALGIVIEKVQNYNQKLMLLKTAERYDEFESVLFELIVAARYASIEGIDEILFIKSSEDKSPDIEIKLGGESIYVECKKFDRSTDITSDLRNVIRDKVADTLSAFQTQNRLALIELSFHSDPRNISEVTIRDLCIESFRAGTPIIGPFLTVYAKPLARFSEDALCLYPSPKYYWERYEYKDQSEWFGIVNRINGIFVDPSTGNQTDGTWLSSWLSDADFECAIKWKITDEEIMWQYKRLGYTRLFKGLDQLSSRDGHTVLHAWFERDASLGHRQRELLDFFKRISTNAQDNFSWIIFNETALDVSVSGRFDLIEHSHKISGPSSTDSEPLVTTVFVDGDGDGEFGIGQNYPELD